MDNETKQQLILQDFRTRIENLEKRITALETENKEVILQKINALNVILNEYEKWLLLLDKGVKKNRLNLIEEEKPTQSYLDKLKEIFKK